MVQALGQSSEGGSAFQDVSHFVSADQTAQVAVGLEGGPLCPVQGGLRWMMAQLPDDLKRILGVQGKVPYPYARSSKATVLLLWD